MNEQGPSGAHGLVPHGLRGRVIGEVHARPFSPLRTPCRVLHYGFMTDGDAAAADRAALARVCADLGIAGPHEGAKHHRAAFSGACLRWESHSEFTTYTWEIATDPAAQGPPATPFEASAESGAAFMGRLPPPGPLLVAVDLHLVPEGWVPSGLSAPFGSVQLAAAEVEGGAGVIATDFRPDPLGFVRVLVVDRGLSASQAGALVQRVLEIETYRMLALLGLPEAQHLAPSIRRIETELPDVMNEMQQNESLEANHRLLNRLTALAAELEAGAAGSLFRFGATRAYDELVRLRLQAIGEGALDGYPSWSAFLSRRMAPAIRTCSSTEERQANLSRKLARAAQLLRTRVDIALESQNRDVLRTMNERVRLQLRLQQTVEGLSVAAITYYVANLFHLLLEGIHAAGYPVNATVGTAVLVPVILVSVAWIVRRIRREHPDPHDT